MGPTFGPGEPELQVQSRARSPERDWGSPLQPPRRPRSPAVPAPPPSLPQARQGLRLSYNEICSRPPGLGARVCRASLGLGMGSTSWRSSRGDRAGPHRSWRRPGWGLGRFGAPDVPRRSPALPPFCRMCLRLLFRFRRYFLQRPKNVQVGFKSDQETEEAAAQVRPSWRFLSPLLLTHLPRPVWEVGSLGPYFRCLQM